MRARDEREQLVDGNRRVLTGGGGDRDDLLGEHVERVARDDRRLDPALAHQPGDDRALEQVGAELGEDPALAALADAVPGAADPLQPAADRLRRLDLDHEVDRAHVDAELERRGRDEARQLAGLQQLLDDRALLARERAVMGARDLADGLVGVELRGRVRELVEPQRQPLGAAPAVDEHDRRRVLLDERAGSPGRSPARSSGASPRRRAPARARRRRGCGRRPARPSTRPARGCGGRAPCARRRRSPGRCAAGRRGTGRSPRAGSASRTARCAAGPAVGRRDWFSLSRSSVSARCEPRLVPATAWISSTITASTPVRISRAPLVSMRYSDSGVVIRMSGGRRRIAARSFCGVSPVRTPIGSRSAPDPPDRRDEVAVDVVGERLQRRDVDDPRTPLAVGRGVRDEPVDAPEERGERLARAGRRADQRVLAGGDRRPRLRLRRGRLGERAGEPVADLRGELRERHRRPSETTPPDRAQRSESASAARSPRRASPASAFR